LSIKSILVPTDFSPESEKALVYALGFAKQFGAKLTLVHVVEPIPMADFRDSFPIVIQSEDLIAAGKQQMTRLLRDLEIDPAVIEQTEVRYGRAFNEITEAARAANSDIIILSTHGYTGLAHAFLGSTTERVVRHAPCPVLVVRTHEHDFIAGTANARSVA
jgi:nucleotide-binding universal stress UspA family protein